MLALERHIAVVLLLTLNSLLIAQSQDKSGVSPNTISLPTGPGSIEGLGESFQPTLNTGTAKYGVRLVLPPGVTGHAPALALRYEGGGANGVLGYGWSFPTGFIQRRSDEGIPTYGRDVGFPREDTFINEAKEELVPTGDGFFFCKNEAAFVRYRRVDDHWEATTPEGTHMAFGTSAVARVQDEDGRIYCWLLERVTDTRGNTITYHYESFPGSQNLNQVYLESIRYGPGEPPWENFHFVRFQYEDRSDWFEDCRAGFPVRTGKRLRSVVIGTQGPSLDGHLAGDFDGDGVTDFLVRRYDLEHLEYAGSDSHWSLLSGITQVGADGMTALPPARFGYVVCNPQDVLDATGHIVGSHNTPAFVMDNPLVDLIDLNGDGLPDLLKTDLGGGEHTAFLNEGERIVNGRQVIRWSHGISMGGPGEAQHFNLQSQEGSGNHGSHLADMDGDGVADYVVKAGPDNVFYFANQNDTVWGERRQMTIQDYAPPAPFGIPGVRTGDFDFDKRIDIIRSLPDGQGYHIWFNLGDQTYSHRILVEPDAGQTLDLNHATVQIADLNGDRVPDIAWIRPSSVIVTPGLGYGRFGPPVEIPLPDDWILTALQLNRAKLTDITGNGLADLVIERAEGTDLWYWINLGTYRFTSRKRITGLPAPLGLNAAIRWADLNGNGTVDYVFADRESDPPIQMVDLGELILSATTPNVLTEISNGIGRVTQIGYVSSTVFRLADADADRPWPDPVPFPVQVVGSVTNLDSLGNTYVTQFRYHDGYYDPVEKQFRGFAGVEQIDLGGETAPTLVTRSHFDTGRDFEPMKGKLLQLTAEQEDGSVFWDDFTEWVSPPRTLMTGINGTNVVFVHPIANTKVITELGRGTERRLESEFAYDEFGNQTTNANYGIVVDGDRSAFNDERIVVTEYAVNTDRWLLRYPSREEIRDLQGNVISRAEYYYDDETFTANNLGEVTLGNLTMKREWRLESAEDTHIIKTTRTQYDRFGNPVILIDPLARADAGAIDFSRGHGRELVYDPAFHTYPIREVIHVGDGSEPLLFQAEYNPTLGTVTASIDFNDNRSDYRYDPLGRLTAIVKPYDTVDFPTVEYEYRLAEPFGADGIVNWIETRQLDKDKGSQPAHRDHYFISRQFIDGLGRNLMNKTEAEPAEGSSTPRVVVTAATIFNARQSPSVTLNPHFSLMAGTLDELLGFEDLNALGWQGQFHDEGILKNLDLADAHQTKTEYDATLREIRIINPDRTLRRVDYEPLLTRTYDENDTDPDSPYHDTPMVHHQDGLGRLIRVDETTRLSDEGFPVPDLRTWNTLYGYDLNDQLTTILDSQNNLKTFGYDGLKRKIRMDDPNRGKMDFRYDDASNLIETVDAKDQRITYTYDGVNRIRMETYHDGRAPPPWRSGGEGRAYSVVYHYDTPLANLSQGDNTTATARNVEGALAWVEDLSGEEHTSYDARGRVEWVVKRIPDLQFLSHYGSSALVSYRTAFSYDSLDRNTRLVYPDNDEISYAFDDRSLLRAIIGGVNGLTQDGYVVPSIHYAPSGQLERTDYGNGVRTTHTSDSRLRLKNILTVSPNATPSQELINFAYDFDAVSNIKSITDQRPGLAVPANDPRRNTQVFRYDDVYRLTHAGYVFAVPPSPLPNGWAQGQVLNGEIDYRYDRIGNMLAQTSTFTNHVEKGLPVANLGEMESGSTAGRWGRKGRGLNDDPGPHALTAIRHSSFDPRHYPYDANGNMTDIDGLVCTWDFKDRLVAVENEQMRATYTYDYTDRRIAKDVSYKPGSANFTNRDSRITTLYINKYFEVRNHDAPTKYVWNGNTRVARVTGSLSTNKRVQRLRVYPGWNLCSLAVSSSSPLWGEGRNEVLSATFRWSPVSLGWDEVAPNETLPGGPVLWLNANTNATLTITGIYSDPTNRTVTASGNFLASAGLEAWNLESAISHLESVSAWFYTSVINRWLPCLPPPLSTLNPHTSTPIAPGQAAFARADALAQLEVPECALRMRYYHQDHLGSLIQMSDTASRALFSPCYFPFGSVREVHPPTDLTEPYSFVGKEQDVESTLNTIGVRMLASGISRFTRPDPAVALMASEATFEPQKLNSYSYCESNPINTVDPTGLVTVSTQKRSIAEVVKHFEEMNISYGRGKGKEPLPIVLSDGRLQTGKLNCTTYLAAALSIWFSGEIDAPVTSKGTWPKRDVNLYARMTRGADGDWQGSMLEMGATPGSTRSNVQSIIDSFAEAGFGETSAVIVQVTDRNGNPRHVGLAYYDEEKKEWRVSHAAGPSKPGKVISQSLGEFQDRQRGQRFNIIEVKRPSEDGDAVGYSVGAA